ncbi:unnamed protein product, partial [Pleuronectes platessa]
EKEKEDRQRERKRETSPQPKAKIASRGQAANLTGLELRMHLNGYSSMRSRSRVVYLGLHTQVFQVDEIPSWEFTCSLELDIYLIVSICAPPSCISTQPGGSES